MRYKLYLFISKVKKLNMHTLKTPKCPHCNSYSTYRRDDKTPHWKCKVCGFKFDIEEELKT
jgi:ribosomal protein L37AE/L43A